jgi:hypothetical protein
MWNDQSRKIFEGGEIVITLFSDQEEPAQPTSIKMTESSELLQLA